jgi:hypothetical protein
MNIEYSESPALIVAKTYGCKDSRKVTYSLINETHALCIDKKDLIVAEFQACEKLELASDEKERAAVELEIRDLKRRLTL